MSLTSLAALKDKFKAGAIPTGQDWIDLLDSFLLADQTNFPNPLPAVSAQLLTNLPTPSASTINVAEFNTVAGTPVYITSTSFYMSGNLVSYFPENRRVKLTHASTNSFLTVISSSYDVGTDKTTINTLEPIANSSPLTCLVATVNPLAADGSVTQQSAGFTRGSTLTAASTLDVGFEHYSFEVDGNTNITAISQRALGTLLRLKFNGTPLLSHGSALSLLSGGDLTAAAGDIMEFESVSAGWRQVGNASISESFGFQFRNLQASATGTSATISVSADEVAVRASNGRYRVLDNVSVSINSGASGANGLDTGSLLANTWYALYVIWNGATAAGLISLSASAPSLPSGYTHKARVGWIRTDSSGNKYPLSFKQYGREVRYKVASGSNVANLPSMASGVAGNLSSPTWAAVATGNFVPSTAAHISFVLTQLGAGAMVAPNNQYGAATSSSNPPIESGALTQNITTSAKMMLESSNIYWASSGASNGLFAAGWEDNL